MAASQLKGLAQTDWARRRKLCSCTAPLSFSFVDFNDGLFGGMI